jgi:hypothetical protein
MKEFRMQEFRMQNMLTGIDEFDNSRIPAFSFLHSCIDRLA